MKDKAPESEQGGLTLALAPSDRAPAQAREALGHLSTALTGRTFETLQLLVTELVANSVRHAGLAADDKIRVELTRLPSKIRVVVRDSGRGFRPELPPSRNDRGGMGLVLVDRLASRWSVQGNSDSSVWFELEA